MGCGASTGTQPEKLQGQAWIVECHNLIETLRKLEGILKDLLSAEQDCSTSTTAGDRKLGLQLLLDDAASERRRLEDRLEDDPAAADPINLPELAATLLRALTPLVEAQAEARGATAPAPPAPDLERPAADCSALVLLGEQVRSLELVACVDQSDDIQIGSSVRISGLLNAPELNGASAIAESYDEASGRWMVTLQGGAAKKVRRCNLQVVHS